MLRATTLWACLLAFTAPSQTNALPEGDQQVLTKGHHNWEHIREKLAEAGIIPNVIDDFIPGYGLSAAWKSDTAKLGNTLKPSKLDSQPSVHLESLKSKSEANDARDQASNMTHVIVLTDPDAPSHSHPEWSQVCHWIAAGVPFTSSDDASTLHLEDVIEYKPPGPPPKTGKHRYVFVILVPANGTTEQLHLEKPKDRKRWGTDKEGYGVREWAHKHGLIPVAANFIYAQNKKQ